MIRLTVAKGYVQFRRIGIIMITKQFCVIERVIQEMDNVAVLVDAPYETLRYVFTVSKHEHCRNKCTGNK